jgi:hypothetical protein
MLTINTRTISIFFYRYWKEPEIANHISAIRTQAKQLQQQAAAELEQAKQQVEQLILGK